MKTYFDKYGILGTLLILLYMVPSIVEGENHFLLIHDFLDSTVAHIQSMKDCGALFDFGATMPILSGIPRYVYGSACDLKIWLFALLPSYWAAIAGIFIIKLTAFWGMYVLLRKYVIPGGEAFVCFLSAIIFAFVPFYPDYGISSAGVPMVALAFLNLYNKRNCALSALLLIYYAIFSWLVLSGVFVCIVAALAILLCWIKEKKLPLMPFLGLCLLTATYVFANFQLFVNYLSPGEPSHRSAFASAGFSLLSILNELSILLISQYHAGTCLAALIVVLFIIEWRKYRREDKFLDYIFTVYLSITGLFLLGVAVKEGLSFISFIREFQVDRFFFLFPAIFFTMFGAVVYEYVRHARRKALIWSCVALVLVNFAFDPHSRDNIARKLEIANCPGFNQFYDTKLFDRIKTDLKIKEFDDKVICLGMYQAVAEYNDIYTVDGYIQMYPLRYKLQFQKVIVAPHSLNAFSRLVLILSTELAVGHLRSKTILNPFSSQSTIPRFNVCFPVSSSKSISNSFPK